MKNLIVFGDSFNAINMHFPGTHWSEILSKKYNLNLISLARHGCSTRYIVFQILHALEISGDNIIVGSHSASYTRVEILTKKLEEHKNISMNSFENYDIDNKDDSFIRSLNMFTLLDDTTIEDNDKHFLLKKFPLELNYHIDKWGMFFALDKLKESNSKFSYIANLLFPSGDLFDDTYINNKLGEQHVFLKNEMCFKDFYIDRNANPEFVDPGYHTTFESQNIIAEKIEEKFKRNGWL